MAHAAVEVLGGAAAGALAVLACTGLVVAVALVRFAWVLAREHRLAHRRLRALLPASLSAGLVEVDLALDEVARRARRSERGRPWLASGSPGRGPGETTGWFVPAEASRGDGVAAPSEATRGGRWDGRKRGTSTRRWSR
jgi:hypothetical protein